MNSPIFRFSQYFLLHLQLKKVHSNDTGQNARRLLQQQNN